jgi:hypothetical protein
VHVRMGDCRYFFLAKTWTVWLRGIDPITRSRSSSRSSSYGSISNSSFTFSGYRYVGLDLRRPGGPGGHSSGTSWRYRLRVTGRWRCLEGVCREPKDTGGRERE